MKRELQYTFSVGVSTEICCVLGIARRIDFSAFSSLCYRQVLIETFTFTQVSTSSHLGASLIFFSLLLLVSCWL